MKIIINSTQRETPLKATSLPSLGDCYLNFLHCVGYRESDFPLGDFLGKYYCLEGKWLAFSLVHWEATHNDAIISAIGPELGLTEQESFFLFEEVRRFLRPEGFELRYHTPEIWLLKGDDKPLLSSRTVFSLLHQSMMHELKEIDASLFWQRLLTELQMFLSNHPLNAKRMNRLAINGAWIWGSGEFSLQKKRIVTDDPLLVNIDSQTIRSFDARAAFKKHDVVFLKEAHALNDSSLISKFRSHDTCWYWNNIAYLLKKKRWWLGRE